MKKTEYFNVRLTPADVAKLRGLAAASGESEAEIVRTLIRTAKAVTPAVATFEQHNAAGVRQDIPRGAAA